MQYLPPWVLIDLIDEQYRELDKAARRAGRSHQRTSPLKQFLRALGARRQQRQEHPEAVPGGIPACDPRS